MPRLFDALFTTKGAKGTGLGLAVTKKIVEEHNGGVDARSGPDGGAEFILRLPKEIGRPIDHPDWGDRT
jgi:signal transduction histidine kinase